jgi:uncharacterized protein YjbI with pentapeptide repeats
MQSLRDLSSVTVFFALICCLQAEAAEGVAPEFNNNNCSAFAPGERSEAQANCYDLTASAEQRLERSMMSRDGSSQGQVKALEFLVSKGYTYDGVDLSGVNLSGIHLTSGSFIKARFHVAGLARSSCERVDFSGSGFRFAMLDNATFKSTNFSNIYAPFLHGVGAKFISTDLSGTNLSGAALQNASFENSKLRGSSFAFADLRGAQFRDSDLTDTNFEGAVLTGASFVGSQFSNVAFDGAVTDNANLSNEQRQGLCRIQDSSGSTTSFKYMMRLLEEWKSDKYDSGYEFEEIVSGTDEITYKIDPELRKCSKGDSAVGFVSEFPAEWQVHVERNYTEKAGRREAMTDQVNNQISFVTRQIVGH